jgi:hypothetical protein
VKAQDISDLQKSRKENAMKTKTNVKAGNGRR